MVVVTTYSTYRGELLLVRLCTGWEISSLATVVTGILVSRVTVSCPCP